MKYNFNELIERRGTNAIKYDEIESIWGRSDLIPLWVADMDFKTPAFIINAIQKRMEHEIFGYTCPPDSYYDAVKQWVNRRYHMNVEKECIHYLPGIVPGIHHAICAFTEKGDKVLIQPPVYHPFRQIIEGTGRVPAYSPLIIKEKRLYMDMESLRNSLKGCRMFILCNPHNPGGMAWTTEELEQVAEICKENDVIVVSDEIHADMVLAPHMHHPFANINEWTRQHTITFMAPSKVFNMPGIIASESIIFNAKLREQYHQYIETNGLAMGNVFSYIAAEAAYQHGEKWLKEMLEYVKENMLFIDQTLKSRMPKIKAILPEASFLVFLDCRELEFNNQKELINFFANEARLGLNSGDMFGKEGIGFMRFNAAAPRKIIEQAMLQLEEAYLKHF